MEDFRAEVEAYLKRTGAAPTTFGKAVLSDPTFVFRLRGGRELKMGTVAKVRAFMAANRKGLPARAPAAAE